MGTRASIQAAIEQLVERAVVACASAVRERLIATTPVDTGNARAHWLQTVGRPADPSTGRSHTESAALGAAIEYRLSDGDVFVSNFVPYIRRLNNGWSSQAPAGYVEQAVSEAVAEVQRGLA